MPSCWASRHCIKWKPLSSIFLWCCSLCCKRWLWLLNLWVKPLVFNSSESYGVVLSCGILYYAEHGCSHFWVWGWNPEGKLAWQLKWKLLGNAFLLQLMISVILTTCLYCNALKLFEEVRCWLLLGKVKDKPLAKQWLVEVFFLLALLLTVAWASLIKQWLNKWK